MLRVLGDLLEADFSSFNSSEDVRNAALTGFSDASLGARIRTLAMPDSTAPVGLERVADVPIYHSDALARRGQALATTSYGKQPRVRLSGETASSLSLTNGARVKVTQAGQTTRATVAVDNRVPPGSVRIPLATEVSAALGNASAAVTLEAV